MCCQCEIERVNKRKKRLERERAQVKSQGKEYKDSLNRLKHVPNKLLSVTVKVEEEIARKWE